MGKLDLDKLKVQSFVTSVNQNEEQTVKGGRKDSRLTPDGIVCTDQCPGGEETINWCDNVSDGPETYCCGVNTNDCG